MLLRGIERLKLFALPASEIHFAGCAAIGPVVADKLFRWLGDDPEPYSAVVHGAFFPHLEAGFISVNAAHAILAVG